MGCVHSAPLDGNGTEIRSIYSIDTCVKQEEDKGDVYASDNNKSVEKFDLKQSEGVSFIDSTRKAVSDANNQQSLATLDEIKWKKCSEKVEILTLEALNEITRSACSALDAPLSLIGLFDTRNVWYLSGSGQFTPGLSRTGTFCEQLYKEARSTKSPVEEVSFIVTNASEDPRFCNHPSVLHKPLCRFYAGVPLLSDGHIMGTFSVIDFTPRNSITPKQEITLRELSKKTVDVLQQDVVQQCCTNNDGRAVSLPAVWVDTSTSTWKVVGINNEWRVFTGVEIEDFEAYHGFLNVLTPGDDAEFMALCTAVLEADKEKNPSLPAILTPTSHGGEGLQFVFALKPSHESTQPPIPVAVRRPIAPPHHPCDPNIWIAEVHARIRVPEPEVQSPKLLHSRSSMESSDTNPSVTSTNGLRTTLLDQTWSHTTGGTHLSSISSDGSLMPSPLGKASSSDKQLRIPARLASLQLGLLIGKGSYGTVYAGSLRGRGVAVKIIERLPGPAGDIQIWEAQYEALIALQKRHDNIVPTIDWVGNDGDGQVWIIQEMCDLGTLASHFKQGILKRRDTNEPNVKAILETALDVARGMQYLHSEGILHGDLSSNNILLSTADNDRGFVAKVTDFGMSRNVSQEIMTKSLGTISHMPAELLVEGIFSKAVDVYSFGVCLCEMWSCQRAWDGVSLGQLIFAVTVKNQTLALPPGAFPALAELAADCQRREYTGRPSFDDIVVRLESMLLHDDIIT